MIFDGKAFARKIEEQVRERVMMLAKKPKVVSILVGNNPASALYTKLKQQAAERVGIIFEVMRLEPENLHNRIEQIAEDEQIDGLMIQLPVPGYSKEQTEELLKLIPLEKDVDGLRWRESGVKPAAVRAILSLAKQIAQAKTRYAVLGAQGAVGAPLVYWLHTQGIKVSEIEVKTPHPANLTREAEVIISCVGKAGLVTSAMISEGSIVIDVGMSETEGKVVGDMTDEVYQKASIAVGVPGGVGPVTVASLMANVADLL